MNSLFFPLQQQRRHQHAACIAGFTSKEAYQMGIPAIGIVAVLVANVTFIA